MRRTHIMVDLETADTKPTAAIFSIGAVAFTAAGVTQKFHAVVDLQSCVDAGLTINGDTLYWWLQQSDQARRGITGGPHDCLSAALRDFGDFVRVQGDDVCVWGNGAAFDNAILQNAYAACALPLPWKFWNDRCYRTAKVLAPHIASRRVGTHHNALDDAETQALHLIEIARTVSPGLLP